MRLTADQRNEVRRRAAAGEGLRAMARDYGVSHTAIAQYVRGEMEGRDRRAAAKLRRRWADVSEAAAALGVSQEVLVLRCVAGEFPGAARIGETWLMPRRLLPAD